jgi:hypothetical protein
MDLVKFLIKLREEDIYKLLLLDEHTDEEFEDIDEFIQTNDEITIFLNMITYNPTLFMDESIIKYFELRYDEPKEYLTTDLLMLLYYMADNNDMDTNNLSNELKKEVINTINIFKELIQLDDEKMIKNKILIFTELLNKSLPLACKHMLTEVDKSNLYQQMMNSFGKINVDFDKYLDTILPTDNEKEDFIKRINEITYNDTLDNQKYDEITDEMINY